MDAAMRKRRLLLLILLSAVATSWIAGAGLVMFWNPEGAIEAPTLDGRSIPFLPMGYTATGSAVSI